MSTEPVTVPKSTPSSLSQEEAVELSIVMPCLNEADTIENCVRIAMQALKDHCIVGEVVVADNGSTDGSREIAARMGARVIPVSEKGYGSALRGGIAACRGRYVLMGDADESYDFAEAFKFVAKLREGYELVQGCRLPTGGGTVKAGAMPVTHRWIGNPGFSLMARVMFQAPINDVYCGMRGFTKSFYESLELRCTGMEFATEMIIKASLRKAKIAEVPITLHPDGRKAHAPHLRTIRDGWRTLRFYLMYSPRWLFILPGAALLLFGALAYGLAITHSHWQGATFGPHTLLVGGLSVILGFNILVFGLIAKSFGIKERFLPPDPKLDAFFGKANLERGLLLGALEWVVGLSCVLTIFHEWTANGCKPLTYDHTMPWIGTGVLLMVLGAQTVFSSFIVSLIGLDRK